MGVEEKEGGLIIWPEGTVVNLGPTCPKGFKRTSEGGCAPILPNSGSVCPAGSRQALGSTTCQPLGSCGQGDYGDITTSSGTIFVNASYKGSNSNGTRARPYRTIGAALKVASKSNAHSHVAVAAGIYQEDLRTDIPLTLQGRCAKLVTIVGRSKGKDAAAVTIGPDAKGSVIRGLTIKGPHYGILLSGAVAVVIHQVAVLDTGHAGIRAQSFQKTKARGRVKGALLSANGWAGISLSGAGLTVENIEVRGAKSVDDKVMGHYGRGIAVEHQSELALRDSVIQTGKTYGIGAYSSTVIVERSVIRDNGFRGFDSHKSRVTLKQTVFQDNGSAGIVVGDAVNLTVDSCTVTGTRQWQWPKSREMSDEGFGLWALKSSDVVITDSLFSQNGIAGLLLMNRKSTVKRSIVRDTLERLTDQRLGIGIVVGGGSQSSAVTIQESLVSGNREFGVQVLDATAIIERTVVRGTLPPRPYGRFDSMAVGIGVFGTTKNASTNLILRDGLLVSNTYKGIFLAGGDASVESSVIRDTGSEKFWDATASGIVAMVHYKNGTFGRKARLAVKDSVLAHNRPLGLLATYGSEVTVDRTSLRDSVPRQVGTTKPEIAVLLYLHGQPKYVTKGYPVRMKVRDSLLEVHGTSPSVIKALGVLVDRSSSATLEASTVRIFPSLVTGQSLSGAMAIFWGTVPGPLPVLKMKGCEVYRSVGPSISLLDGTLDIERSRLFGAMDPYGDCLYSEEKDHRADVHLKASLVQGCERAGVFLNRGGGSLCESLFFDNTFPIHLDGASAPTLCEDNLFERNKRNSISFGSNLKPAPLPKLPELNLTMP